MEKLLLSGFLTVVLVVSCSKLLPKSPDNAEVLDGPIEGLSNAEMQQFLKGDLAFTEVFTQETGLGSTFVAASCISCHAGDGKGHPSTTLVRFGQSDETGNQYLDQGGPQLQNRAIPGFQPESIPHGATSSKFTPPANTGLGYLDYVTDQDILEMADPDDMNGDGISGTPNWIAIPSYISLRPNSVEQNGKHICRFGKKASAYDLLHQTVNAYNQDMGIASVFSPVDVYSGLEVEPEVTSAKVQNLVFYLRTLKAPIPRNQGDNEVLQGKELFEQLNCVACHKSQLKTGYSPISVLSYKTFAPYTDLLLHDMGPALDDHYTEGSAKTSEWRTAPLWGLGLSKSSQGGQYYLLHDGRAHTIEEAILYHGGEATASKNAYQALSGSARKSLIKFLESL